MPTFTSLSALKFKLEFNISSLVKTFKFTDNLGTLNAYNTAIGLGMPTSVKGLVKLRNTTLGITVYENPNFTAGTFGAPDINSGTADWNETQNLYTVSSAVPCGTYQLDYRTEVVIGGVSYYYEYIREFTYCVTVPAMSIDREADCTTSQITVTDETDYTLTLVPSGTIDPLLTVTREWSVTYPNNVLTAISEPVGLTSLVFGNGTAYNAGANIYTGDYAIALESYAVYQQVTGDANFEVYYNYTFAATTTLSVTCSTCSCTIRECVNTFLAKWEGYLGVNIARANEMFPYVIKVMSNWMRYMQAERCGAETTEFCQAISDAIHSAGCDCITSTTTTGVEEVIPVSGSGGGGGTPDSGWSDSLGTVALPVTSYARQYHLFTSTGVHGNKGDIYLYSSGAWSVGPIVNTAGADGLDGADGVDSYVVLENELTDVDNAATVLDETLDTVIIPKATVITNGDIVQIEAKVAIPTYAGVHVWNDRRTISIYFDLTLIAQVICDYDNTTAGAIVFDLQLHRVSNTSQKVICKTYFNKEGQPNSCVVDMPIMKTLAYNLTTTDINVAVHSLTTVASAASVTLNQLSLKYINIEP